MIFLIILGNYRSAIKDCESALQIIPSYKKAIKRGIECTFKLLAYDEVIEWCDKGLYHEPSDQDILASRSKAINEKVR